MNVRLTAILFVILILVGGAAYYVNQQEVNKPQPGAEPELLLYERPSEDVTRIEIHASDKTVALERSGDRWRLTAPEAAEADPFRSEGLAFQLSTVRATRRITDTADLGQFGLDRPTYTVTVRFKDGTTRQILFGKDNPLGTGTYAKLADSPTVYLLVTTIDAVKGAITAPPKATPTPTPTTTATATAATPTPTP